MQDLAGILPLLVLGLLAYFLFIRPARNRAKDVQKLQNALSAGDEVMLTSGIFGTVQDVVDDRVTRRDLRRASVSTVHRGAIGKIIRDVPADLTTTSTSVECEADVADDADAPVSEPDPSVEPTATDEDPNPRGAN